MSIPTQRTPAGPQQQSPEIFNELQSEVSTEAAPLLQFILKHAGVIVTGLVLFVVILAGTAGYNWYSERGRVQAQKTLATVTLTTQGAERVAALEKFVAGAPASIKNAALLALADAAITEKNYVLAAKSFGLLAAADPQGALGLLAALNQGQALLSAGKASEALPVLEKLVSLMPEGQRNVARQSLAEAALKAGEKAKAKETFEAMAKASTGPESDFYRYRAQSIEVTPPAAQNN